MALSVKLRRGQRVVVNDVHFTVLKSTEILIESNVDLRIYESDGTLRHHKPKVET